MMGCPYCKNKKAIIYFNTEKLKCTRCHKEWYIRILDGFYVEKEGMVIK